MNVRLAFQLYRLGVAPRPASAVSVKPPVRTLSLAPAPNATVYGDPYITPAHRPPSRRRAAAAVAVLALVIAITVAFIR